MAVATHPIAAQVGADVLSRDGSAFDAAVAMSATLTVVCPDWAGLAGDSAWLLYDAARESFHHLDAYSTCPKGMTGARLEATFGLSDASDSRAFDEEPPGVRDSGIATAMTPGTPGAWQVLLNKYCRLTIDELLSPAVLLAYRGFTVNRYLAESFRISEQKLRRYESTVDSLFDSTGELPREGSTLIQRELGKTLERMVQRGIDEFYKGSIASSIGAYTETRSASIARTDLEEYRAVWRDVRRSRYRHVDVVTTGSPTAGSHLLQALKLAEGCDFRGRNYHGGESLHWLIEISKLALAERRLHGGDPDEMPEQLDHLLSEQSIAKLAAQLQPDKCLELGKAKSLGAATTHFVAWDANGNLASVTQSIGSRFGCGEIVPSTGLLMNDRSWWLALRNGPNAAAPGKRANIGHAPVMLCSDGRPVVALGSPGGFGILQYMLQVIVNMIDYDLDVQDAVEAPRFRLEGLGRRVWMEGRIAPSTLSELSERGHEVINYPPWSDRMGGVIGLQLSRDGHSVLGGYDARRNSMAVGLH